MGLLAYIWAQLRMFKKMFSVWIYMPLSKDVKIVVWELLIVAGDCVEDDAHDL